MPFTLAHFLKQRPFLYHNTTPQNAQRILAVGELLSPARLVAGRPDCEWNGLDQRLEWMTLEGVHLQTQKPLVWANIEFTDGWRSDVLLKRLNELVFFWPGDAEQPIGSGRRHSLGNDWPSGRCSTLRIPTQDLLEANPDASPLFSPFNSGSPRYSGGRQSPRGGKTFLPSDLFERTAGAIIEVVFEGSVRVPSSAHILTAN